MLCTAKVGQKYRSAEAGEATNKATWDSVSVTLLKVEVIQGFYKFNQGEVAVSQQFKPWKA